MRPHFDVNKNNNRKKIVCKRFDNIFCAERLLCFGFFHFFFSLKLFLSLLFVLINYDKKKSSHTAPFDIFLYKNIFLFFLSLESVKIFYQN